MARDDITKFQLKRVSPFQGLVIDADTWRDAHNYHRDQQRLHLLAFHQTGIVKGLEVTANNPPDLSVTIHPGMGIDPEGNVIIVPQTQHYRLQTRKPGVIYLVVQFREVPAEPYQPPEGGQPTRILEAYRIEESEKLPAEPHLELARIDFDPTKEVIRDAKAPSHPGKSEINLSFRPEVTRAPAPAAPAVLEKPSAPASESTGCPRETVTLGHAVLGEASKDLHRAGLRNLIKETNRQANLAANLEENIALDKNINRCTLLYLTGTGHFELSAEQQAALGTFLQSGGVIFGEGSSEGQGEAESKGAKEFGLAFNKLASQLNCKLEVVQRGHPLLDSIHIFSEVPLGAEPAGMLLEGGHMVYSGNDYGCAWQGGQQNHPLSREIIRSSFEMGANIIAYARMIKASGH
jgi:hypothetical protein